MPGGASDSRRAAALETPYGLASSSWELGDGTVTVDAVVPPNTTAHVRLPGASEELLVGSGTHSWTVPYEPVETPEAGTSWGNAARDNDAQRDLPS